jgi:prophage maintenance system killer protein/prophage antirepressor-like protein
MSDIVIYENGEVELKATIENETVWLTQKQLCELFDRDKSVVSRHIKNIFKDNELDEFSVVAKNATTASDGKIYNVEYYNLDMIISVGYRVNSKKATQFRKWSTKILKEYLIKGYTLNKERLQQKKFDELDATIKLIKSNIENHELTLAESKGFVEIVSNYARSWALLQGYDEQSLIDVTQSKKEKFVLGYTEAKEAIELFKKTLMDKGEATVLFGQEKAGEFKGNLLNIYQTFGGYDLLPSLEQKASNLLYYVIKGHPFNDGNKRIGAYLFILFLAKNKALYKANGELKINDNALASLALLVATSMPEQKDIIIKLIMNMIYEGDGDE